MTRALTRQIPLRKTQRRGASGARLPLGYGLVIGAAVSLGLWAAAVRGVLALLG